MLVRSESGRRNIMTDLYHGFQDSYLDILNITASEHLNFYSKAIMRIPESSRYNPTRSKRTDFYYELGNAISTFGFNTSVQIFTEIYWRH